MKSLRKLWLLCAAVFFFAAGVRPELAVTAQKNMPEGDRPRIGLQASNSAVVINPLPGEQQQGPVIDGLPQGMAIRSPGSKIVHQNFTQANNSEIIIGNDDGSGAVQLTNHSGEDITPSLQRGGGFIAFASNRADVDANIPVKTYEIYTMRTDGSGLARLTENTTDDVNPAWSPDSTRIAFQSYRDGHAEVYVMNADGSGQTRLTWDSGGFNGEPSWSPDGSKIAFTSYRNSIWRIWLMNADGSGQMQLSTQRYSENPVWSPDGSKIAYDADDANTGWQQIWVMNADGSSPYQASYWGDGLNLLVRGWSPDGEMVAFTRIHFVLYNGTWYWTEAQLYGRNIVTAAFPLLSASTTDLDSDWQTLDTIAPQSAVNPLAAVSPGPFTVSWGGADSGGSGLYYYNIQVREGTEGAWTDWQVNTTSASAAYPGLGGHTYAFRGRAVDYGLNWEAWPPGAETVTTVETLPPVSHINPLPVVSRSPVRVSCWVTDPGGSGIKSAEIEVSEGEKTWQIANWCGNVDFMGGAGRLYRFRSRTVDTAGNEEAWPAEFDTQTILFDTQYDGTVHDHLGIPFDGAQIQTDPAAAYITNTEGAGRYHVYVGNQVYNPSHTYTVRWSTPFNDLLPGTRLPATADQTHDVYLPPVDNLVQDWGFESGSPTTNGWQVSGENFSVPGEVVDTHSGLYSARLGKAVTGFTLTPIGTIFGDYNIAGLVTGADGRTHVVWQVGSTIQYAWRDPVTGQWSQQEGVDFGQISKAGENLAVDQQGNVNVVDLFGRYYRRSPAGGWSAPVTIVPVDQVALASKIAVDGAGGVHYLLLEKDFPQHRLHYAYRSPGGVWTVPDQLSYMVEENVKDSPWAVDLSGNVHVFWFEKYVGVKYARRSAGGTWASEVTQGLCNVYSIASRGLKATADGTLHMACSFFVDGDTIQIQYRTRSPAGVWSVETVTTIDTWAKTLLLMADDGSKHIVYETWNALYHTRTTASGWTEPALLFAGDVNDSQAVVDHNGLLYLAFLYTDTLHPKGDVMFLRQQAGGAWDKPKLVEIYGRAYQLGLVPTNQPLILTAITNQLNARMLPLAAETTQVTLSQEISLPSDMAHPFLSFLSKANVGLEEDDMQFQVQVQVGAESETLYSTGYEDENWQHHVFDLSDYAGQTITINFSVQQAAGRPFAAVTLDEVSLGSVLPDAWVSLDLSRPAAMPGDTVTYTLSYGNRGASDWPGGTLHMTLPGEVVFQDASVPPDSINGSTFTWNTAPLPALSGPVTISVTVQVAAEIPKLTSLTAQAQLQSTGNELTTTNNTVQSILFIGSRINLPSIYR